MIKDLVTPKDIEAINAKDRFTPDEAVILQVANWSEFQIQSGCYNLFKGAGFGDSAIFVQIDNGGSAIEGIRKKKGATGTQSGWPDVEIKIWKRVRYPDYDFTIEDEPIIYKKKSIYIEFKQIGGKIAENQQKWHDFLKEKDESVHFCNNIIYFEQQIMKEIEEFLR